MSDFASWVLYPCDAINLCLSNVFLSSRESLDLSFLYLLLEMMSVLLKIELHLLLGVLYKKISSHSQDLGRGLCIFFLLCLRTCQYHSNWMKENLLRGASNSFQNICYVCI